MFLVFQYHYFNSETDFDSVQSHRGALSMLHVLDEGIESSKEREARARSGKYSITDIRRKEI